MNTEHARKKMRKSAHVLKYIESLGRDAIGKESELMYL
jgi:hypothetical protein